MHNVCPSSDAGLGQRCTPLFVFFSGAFWLQVLLWLCFAAPLPAQVPDQEALLRGIDHAHRLSTSAIDARLANLSQDDYNDQIFLRFVRLENALAEKNTAAAAPELEHILSSAGATGDETTVRLVCSELANTLVLAGASGSSNSKLSEQLQVEQREHLEALELLHKEQLRAAQEEQRRKDQQIDSLRAQGQLAAVEQMREQLVREQSNQQFQLETMTRRSQLQGWISRLLFVCLLLTGALACALWRINLARKHQALEDPLTGLKNRRFLAPFMEHETLRLRRSDLTALILIADIDHFKNINDRYGHDTGDEALIRIGKIIRHCMRHADIVARWGGEEFVIICPQSGEAHAGLICNRIRNHLSQMSIPAPPGNESFTVTISIGAALFAPATSDESWMATLARADRALYEVKHNGRDNWKFASTQSDPAEIAQSALTTP